jgi:hypothetical protein
MSRYALLVCIAIYGSSILLGGVLEIAIQAFFLLGLVSGLLMGPLALNALIAQFVACRRKGAANHG